MRLSSFYTLCALTLCTICPSVHADKIETPVYEMSNAIINVAKTASPAVVYIQVTTAPRAFEDYESLESFQNQHELLRNLFPHSFELPAPKPLKKAGSGFFINQDGYIVTNHHVIKDAAEIKVTCQDGEIFNARIIGSDPLTDIGVLKVDDLKDVSFLEFADSDLIQIGEWVVAIGSPFQLESSVTAGVISAKRRQNLNITELEDFIQTDAAINQGNSGGPLISLSKQVIGVNTAIFSPSGAHAGISFAIPSNIAKHFAQQIIDKGSVTRGFLGISAQEVTPYIAEAFGLSPIEGAGVLVADVVKGSAAEKAGIKEGDIILQINDKPIKTKSLQSFRNEIALSPPGKTLKLTLFSDKEKKEVSVTLESSSDQPMDTAVVEQKIGIEVTTLTPMLAQQYGYSETDEGVIITSVFPRSPAYNVGIHPGSLLLSIDHIPVKNIEEYNTVMKSIPESKKAVLLKIQENFTKGNTRHSQKKYFSIQIDK